MRLTNRGLIILGLAALAAYCSGCGGGGGGGSAAVGGLTATAPDLTGKVGDDINVPVNVSGSTVYTARFDVRFSSGYFEQPAAPADAGDSVAVTMAGDAVCRYKWVDAQTVRIVYASREGTSSGAVLVQVPLKVAKEGACGLVLQNVVVNQ